ncbi:MAG: hypothetical protein MUO64_03995 [Anaerolineales bacterium]|nr:hypothetical protein [Anaerolineales bacterium]
MYEKPKGFSFIRVFCIFIGGIGTIGGIITILAMQNPSINQTLQQSNQGFLATFWDMLRNAGFLIGGILIFKMRNHGRLLIVICATLGLLEVFYHTFLAISSPAYNFTPLLISYTVIAILINSGVLAYFSNKNVKTFILSYQGTEQNEPK